MRLLKNCNLNSLIKNINSFIFRAALLHCKKKQVRNWFAYRRKKLNKLKRRSSGPRDQRHYFSGSNKDNKKENKADSSSLESNKIFLEDKNSTSSTSNQNTKKELSNNESSENKVNSYDSQMKTELNASYAAMKGNAINVNNSQDLENNLTQNTENTDQKLNRMGPGNQPQIIFTNKPYFNQPYNNIYYNNSFNQANPGAIFLNGYSKFAFIPSNMPSNMQNMGFANNQYRAINMLVPINQAVNMNMGYYPMMSMVNQNQLKMGQNGNQWLANVSNERNNKSICMNELKQNEMNMNPMNSSDMNR